MTQFPAPQHVSQQQTMCTYERAAHGYRRSRGEGGRHPFSVIAAGYARLCCILAFRVHRPEEGCVWVLDGMDALGTRLDVKYDRARLELLQAALGALSCFDNLPDAPEFIADFKGEFEGNLQQVLLRHPEWNETHEATAIPLAHGLAMGGMPTQCQTQVLSHQHPVVSNS